MKGLSRRQYTKPWQVFVGGKSLLEAWSGLCHSVLFPPAEFADLSYGSLFMTAGVIVQGDFYFLFISLYYKPN